MVHLELRTSSLSVSSHNHYTRARLHLSALETRRRAQTDDRNVLTSIRPDNVEVLGGQPANRREVVIPATNKKVVRQVITLP